MLGIDPEDWFDRLMSGSRMWMEDIFSECYCDMREEIEIIIEHSKYEDIFTNYLVSRDFGAKYQKGKVDKKEKVVRRTLRHSHSETILPNVITKVKKSGRSRSFDDSAYESSTLPFDIIRSNISAVDKHLFDIIKTNKDINLIVQIPLVNKNNIKLRAYDGTLEIFANTNNGVYHRYVDIPSEADIRSIKSNYNNGILEITFSKKRRPKTKIGKNRNRMMH
jgi:HSP20 family protein